MCLWCLQLHYTRSCFWPLDITVITARSLIILNNKLGETSDLSTRRAHLAATGSSAHASTINPRAQSVNNQPARLIDQSQGKSKFRVQECTCTHHNECIQGRAVRVSSHASLLASVKFRSARTQENILITHYVTDQPLISRPDYWFVNNY